MSLHPITSGTDSYLKKRCFVASDRGRDFAPAGDSLSCLCKKVSKEYKPDCLRPCASLRANLRHAIQSAVRQNSLCAARAAQTGCRKSEHDALALFGANARSPNRVPQAQTHGWERVRTACKIFDEIDLKPRCRNG
jgi:hypothetical protein